MNELEPAVDPEQKKTPRWGTIELLQVISLLALAAGLFQPTIWLAVAVATLGVAIGLVAFFLVRPKQEPVRRLPEWSRGFRLTRERLRTLAQLSVPVDIVVALDESMLDELFKTAKEMRDRLYFLLGEARVGPWLETILLHAKIYGSRETG